MKYITQHPHKDASMSKPRVAKSHEILRHIDPTKKVRVYRNLHKNCLSIKQGGLVRCHADNVVLRDFKTIVNKKGRDKVRKEKVKNVHAYLEGFVIHAQEAWKGLLDFSWGSMYYNPYETDKWTDEETGEFVDCGEFVDVDPESVLAFNYLYEKETV